MILWNPDDDTDDLDMLEIPFGVEEEMDPKPYRNCRSMMACGHDEQGNEFLLLPGELNLRLCRKGHPTVAISIRELARIMIAALEPDGDEGLVTFDYPIPL